MRRSRECRDFLVPRVYHRARRICRVYLPKQCCDNRHRPTKPCPNPSKRRRDLKASFEFRSWRVRHMCGETVDLFGLLRGCIRYVERMDVRARPMPRNKGVNVRQTCIREAERGQTQALIVVISLISRSHAWSNTVATTFGKYPISP